MSSSPERRADSETSEEFHPEWMGPDDPERKFYGIIQRDHVAAFEEYLHNAHCFTQNRRIPYVYAPVPRDGGTPWTVAVNLGSVGVLGALLKYQDYDDGGYREDRDRSEPMSGQWHRQLLHRAVEQNQIGVIRFLLGRPGTDIDSRDKRCYTPILTACYHLCEYDPECGLTLDAWVDRSEEIIGLLLESGANARDEYREEAYHDPPWDWEGAAAARAAEGGDVLVDTTLSLAVGRARPSLLRRLIVEGADVNARLACHDRNDDRGTTLLHIASRWHNVAAVRFLLDERPEGVAMARLRDSRGILPLPWAAVGFFPGYREREGRHDDADVAYHAVETIKALLPHNGVNERGVRGMTALSLAARSCEPPGFKFGSACYGPVVQLLLDNGADPCDAGDDSGCGFRRLGSRKGEGS